MKVLSILSAATAASAHTIFLQLESGGTTYPISYGIRTPTYDGPITDVASNDIACNGGPNPTSPSDKIIPVTAGSTVKAVWRHTLDSGPNDVMDASHLGPTLAYMKKVDNALTDSGIGNGWFKIQQDGYNNGNWGTTEVITNGGLHSIKIPDCIADGEYLLRAEMIALHGAGSPGGAQFYMECAQIKVSGGSGSASPATYSLPGIYKANDPGITINIYSMTPSSTYVIPGPDPFTCSGGSGPGNPVDPPQTTLTTTTKPTTTTTSAAETTTAPSGGGGGCTAQQWDQCGGIGFSGCTECASPFVCTVSNEYYSQCL